MKMELSGFQLNLQFFYQKQNSWHPVPENAMGPNGFHWEDGGSYAASWKVEGGELHYTLSFAAPYPTQLRFAVALCAEEELFPVIPCNLLGDNHAQTVKPGEFPLLTNAHPEIPMCAPRWEFRADRAAAPLSALCCKRGVVALAIEPYAAAENALPDERDAAETPYLRNGLFAELPNIFGVSLGYTNDPVTFTNRSTPQPATHAAAHRAKASGTLYATPGERTALHRLIRREYEKLHRRAEHQYDCAHAADALLETFCCLNYSAEAGEYTNRNCRPPRDTALKPWRNVVEIGWTGGAILAYPLILSRALPGSRAEKLLAHAMSGEALFDRIVAGYNEKSGLLYDLMAPVDATESRLNGWWTGYGLVKDCHCAYTVGSAVYYLTKTMAYQRKNGISVPTGWLECAKKVLDTVVALQRADGAFGYTYSATERRVLDWNGFAGCWFVPALAYLARLTGESRYRQAADRALWYYYRQVKRLDCAGTPMDTWKAPDEEGNLALIRGSRLLHEDTGDARYLQALRDSADYEMLWRYAYPTHPENPPLNHGWNACGGSVTSVSNPHIHPMGVLADDDLRYLARMTGDAYYQSRAEDSTAWMLQTMELYPTATGYGQYGVLSERWCPSDGLTVERYSDDAPYSSWFSFNLWASACVMEAACEYALEQHGKEL